MKKLYSPPAFDALFGVAAALSAVGIFLAAGKAVPAVAAAPDPATKGLIVLGITAAAFALAIFAARIDRTKADDYIFRALMMSAYIGSYTFIFALALATIAVPKNASGFSLQLVVFLWLLSWSLGWGYTRLRGTAEGA